MIAENLGRLFEVGFNIGILTYIEQNNLTHKFGDAYRQDLHQFKFSKLAQKISSQISAVDPLNIQIIEKWSLFFLQKGFLGGLNFFREYVESTGWKERELEILYYQCRFCQENSLGTYTSKSETEEVAALLAQLGIVENIQPYINQYKQKGEFLQADTLMLLRHRQQYRILCVDLSVFSVKTAEDVKNLDDIETIRGLLASEIKYLRSKSFFANLRIDTGASQNLDFNFSEGLARYLTAFNRQDKESAKLIQAGSYAYSFYRFLREMGKIPEEAQVIFNAVGYTDRGANAIALRRENLDFLATCSQIYRRQRKQQEVGEARRQVLRAIQLNVAQSFENGREFVENLVSKPLSLKREGVTSVFHSEKIAGFFNSVGEVPAELMQELGLSGKMNLRQAHAQLIENYLESERLYLFLTGNPGIGKTTAIAKFLQAHIDDGFLFFYVSPRNQVNLDIIDKFKQPESDLLCNDKLTCINSNAHLIADNGGCTPTVQYFCNQPLEELQKLPVDFIPAGTNCDRNPRPQKRIERIAEDTLRDRGARHIGVLNSICEALYHLIDGKISNNIVATASIQSLRITENGANTLRHFEKIFQGAYNKRDNAVLPAQMRAISGRIKHLFIMIDEITGDDSGVEFLNGISSILRRYELTDSRHGFNTKVIVADASIVDAEVINQHLCETSPEPDKIYFRRAVNTGAPLSVQPFQFKRLPAAVINANSYPASSLSVTYKVFVECVKFSKQADFKHRNELAEPVQAAILSDIAAFLQAQGDERQMLVYIQDKRRLAELIEKLKKQRGAFELHQDYLEIHANLSEADKTNIQKHKNCVKVVFMTSSASRGLSFPKAKTILVDIPRFQIEKNLMEVIQVIYRGRGEYLENGRNRTLDTEEKQLIFYLCDRSFYAEENPSLSLQESVLNLLNILLILKTSIMTRIAGFGRVGRENFLMIPIGGKSVSAVGDTFTGQMASLIRDLKNEYKSRRSDRRLLEIYTSLEQLLRGAEFVLAPPAEPSASISYLSIWQSFSKDFLLRANHGCDRLLDFPKLERSYISGSLLVVPFDGRAMEENYLLQLEAQVKTYATDDLLNKMLSIRYSTDYPEPLRSAIAGAIEFANKLREPVKKSQWFEQTSRQADQYYTLPLFVSIAPELMRDYFSQGEESENAPFRDILSAYIRSLYPAGDILPIGCNYKEFPFIIFRCYSFAEMRNKIFTDKYLLSSNELNVLNLILAKSPSP